MKKIHGIFTVVLDDGARRTLRVVTPDEGAFAGKTLIEFLSGADNDSSYTACAFMTPDRRSFNMWKRFANSGLERFIRVLFNREACQRAGLAYAVESCRCWRCGHTLTVPASVHAGLGPECAKHVAAALH